MPANFDPPMRVPQILLGVFLLGVSGLSSRQSCGQAIPVELSKETTFITEPLAEDGLPNYALADLQLQRKGVTAETNAAVPFWQTVGPRDLGSQYFMLLSDELGVAEHDSSYLNDLFNKDTLTQVTQWLANGDIAIDGQDSSDRFAAARHLLSLTEEHPWTEEMLPPLKIWLRENKAPLDEIVAGLARPHFYSPPPNILADAKTSLVEGLLPHAQYARVVAWTLAARANFNAAMGEHGKSWKDCQACWRLGSHIGACSSLVERMVGIAIHKTAMRCTLVLLQSDKLSPALASSIHDYLTNEVKPISAIDSLDRFERLSLLDHILRHLTGRLGGVKLEDGAIAPKMLVEVDINFVLRFANSWMDRIVQLGRVEGWKQQQFEAKLLHAKFEAMAKSADDKKRRQDTLTPRERTQAIAEILVSLLAPAPEPVLESATRDETNIALCRLASALAIFHARNGEYPASLSDLSPQIIQELPADPYSGRQFHYARRMNGYLLYSAFLDGVDNGGGDLFSPIVNGEWKNVDNFSPPEKRDADLAIRVPIPSLEAARGIAVTSPAP